MSSGGEKPAQGIIGRRLSRRELLASGAALAVGAPVAGSLLAACGGSPGQPATKVALKPLRMAADADQWPEQGSGVASTTYQYPFNVNVFETLIRLDPTFKPVPSLATSWELRPPTTWRFHIRRGVRFHDGSALTAEDVKYSLDRAVRGTQASFEMLGPHSNAIVDQYTVDVTPSSPNLHLPLQILHPELSIMKRGTQASDGMGTGPFVPMSYTPHESVVVKRFAGYWGQPARVSQLSVRFISDPNSRVLALRSGEVDVAINPPPDALTSLHTAGYRVLHSSVGQNYLGYLNIHGKPPYDILKDGAVRHALSMSVNRSQLVNDVLTGQATIDPAMGPLDILGPAAASIKSVAYDPAGARRILDQAGWRLASGSVRAKAGRPLALTLISPPSVTPAALDFIAAQAGAVGIHVNIAKSPDSASYSAVRKSGRFDIDVEPPNQNDGDPAFLPILRFFPKGGGAAINYFAPGGAFNTLAEQTLATSDLRSIQAGAAKMMNYLVYDQAIVIAYAGIWELFATNSSVKDLQPHPSLTSQSWAGVRVS